MDTETKEEIEETWEDVPDESENYQYKFWEISMEPRKIKGQWVPDFPEIIKLKRDILISKFFALARENLTQKQYFIFSRTCDGYTQIQIAAELGVRQTTIHKALKGNTYWRNGKKTINVGGIVNRLKKILRKDRDFQRCADELWEMIQAWEEIIGLNV